MEASPLTQAHAHARNAVLETKRANAVAASEEHDLAAAEFATAAQGTGDREALRILNLLEQHHKRLGNILKSRHERSAHESEISADVTKPQPKGETVSKGIPSTSGPPDEETDAGAYPVQHPPRLARPPRATPRDPSSSIAGNLASARGIPRDRLQRPTPITPTVSAQHAGGNFAKEQPYPRAGQPGKIESEHAHRESYLPNPHLRKPPWAPPGSPGQDQGVAEKSDTALQENTSDAPFQQFYATFESLISKLSAPLAFAGLPLTVSTPKSPSTSLETTPAPKTRRPKTPPSSSNPPIDYSQLISRAALRAVRDGPTSTNPAESFYVVPTTGGTISYAEIMSRADRESRHTRTLSGISETTSEDFVDARSTIIPDRRNRGEQAKFNGKTMEELSMENEALKHLSDTLSKRLHVFELSAQSSSAALAQSIRSLQRSPVNTPENSRGKGDARTDARIAELQDLLKKNAEELRKRKEENRSLKDVVIRYREKWDRLKEGARARREGGGPGIGTGTGTGSGPATPGDKGGGKELGDEAALLVD